jgi:hypothetical protein
MAISGEAAVVCGLVITSTFGRGVDFRLAVGQRFINGFGNDGVDLFLRKFLRHERNWAQRGDNRHG